MTEVLWVFVFIIGIVLGSFANVLVHRLPLMIMNNDNETKSASPFNLAKPASHCPCCQAPLRWWQNIPVLSFLVLGARCGLCRARIPWRYLLIELGSGVFALYCFWWFGASFDALMWFFFLYVAWVAAWIDAEHFLLPDVLTLLLLWVALLWKAIVYPDLLREAVLGAALAYSLLRAVYEVHLFFSKRQGMGMGDMKLFAAIGAWFGLVHVPNVLLVACATALLYAVYARMRHHAHMIPLGPFLTLGAVVVLVLSHHL
ncbi:prepilin peptidase [Hydromonas duriensis]|uniref:Prepilin leader peptidase/N-methyltransferase n=1 Tax=Hydromonas duriensis TaxID=1527608 RepID=A0A4R6Y4B8_9BURK|nr:A24 family peptidase [Hydromonas duriensis]TDR28810.1 type 4 prepilin peptidase 1 [Hydromonas duriensis]